MTSVFSKLINETSSKYGIRQERLTKGVVGAVTVLYLIKLGYPYLAASARICINQVKGCKRPEPDHNGKRAKPQPKAGETPEDATAKDKQLREKVVVGLDKAFLSQLLMLLRIMIPGWKTREAGLLTCATVALLARTFLSVYVATLEGQIVKRIVLRDVNGFFWMMARWFAVAFPATFVNSAIRYLEGRLALSFRY
jgi:hypothetical protein